ncbi:MAG TPA: MerR family transcriptional regulator [Gaiellaceae bacterium]|nr:MerR family transcriptional regulator [Gaiellaceae bacterium]
MGESGRPLFSIGAVARMLDLSAATIRTWEARYRLVAPERSQGGQRLYSRAQVEQLRFVCGQIGAGRRPAEAHRLLRERLARGGSLDGKLVFIDPGELGFDEVFARLQASGATVVPIDT